jgi:hypothetical protein
MEKIFVRYSLDKELISVICKELIKLNTNISSNPINKWVNELNNSQKRKLPKIHEQMINILIHKKIQIKTTLRFHLTSVKMAIIKKTNKKC